MKWLAVKPIVGRPSTSSPKPVAVGQREPRGRRSGGRAPAGGCTARTGRVTVLRKRPTTRRGAPVGVALPRPEPEPLELLEPRREHEHDADARQVAQVAAEPTSFSTSRPPRGEQAVGSDGGARRPSARGPRRDGRPRSPSAARRAPTRPAARPGRGRARASAESTPARSRSGSSRSPSLSVAARQSWSAGPATQDVAAVDARARPARRSRGRRPPGCRPASSTIARRLGRQRRDVRPAARGAGRERQRELLPGDLVAGGRPLGRRGGGRSGR